MFLIGERGDFFCLHIYISNKIITFIVAGNKIITYLCGIIKKQ